MSPHVIRVVNSIFAVSAIVFSNSSVKSRYESLAALIFFSTVFALLKTRSFIDFSDSNIQITSVSVFNNFIQCGIIHSRNKRIRVVFFVFYYTSDSFVQRRKTDPCILSKNNSLQYRVSARDNFFIS